MSLAEVAAIISNFLLRLAEWLLSFSLLMKFAARALYFPSIVRLTLREGPTRRWYDRVDDTVILGALPFRSQTKELVEREKVKAVLSYNEAYELNFFTNSKQEWAKSGVERYWFATVDFQPPSLASIWSGLAAIEKHKALNQTVYVHCKAGKGRSTTVVACYLLKSHNLGSPEEALEFIRQRRPQISMNARQKQRISEFQKQLQAKRD